MKHSSPYISYGVDKGNFGNCTICHGIKKERNLDIIWVNCYYQLGGPYLHVNAALIKSISSKNEKI